MKGIVHGLGWGPGRGLGAVRLGPGLLAVSGRDGAVRIVSPIGPVNKVIRRRRAGVAWVRRADSWRDRSSQKYEAPVVAAQHDTLEAFRLQLLTQFLVYPALDIVGADEGVGHPRP